MVSAHVLFRYATRALALAGLLTAACGSTAPSAPSPVPPSGSQYPSVVGDWEANNLLSLVYRDSNAQLSFGCHVGLNVRTQTGGTFSGSAAVQGGNDKQCTFYFDFTAAMSPDGTITRFQLKQPFTTDTCRPVTDTTFNGNASANQIRVQFKDRATCVDGLGNPRDTDRTFTINVIPRSSFIGTAGISLTTT